MHIRSLFSSKTRTFLSLAAIVGLGYFAWSVFGGWTCRSTDELDQCWTQDEKKWWYSVSQGSRLLPLKWVDALERPGADKPELLFAPENMQRYRYLPTPPERARADGTKVALPVGFAIDQEPRPSIFSTVACTTLNFWCEPQRQRVPYVGMTCAACHTSEITYRGKPIRIEGGPTLADFQAFTTDLRHALRATEIDKARFSRFAVAVLGPNPHATAVADLSFELAKAVEWQNTLHAQNKAELDVEYGYGRLDAQGHILNKVALSVGAPNQPKGKHPSDAPVSYPHIWNAPQHDKVQWNGLVANSRDKPTFFGQNYDLGALARNTGEVIGVFAQISAERVPGHHGYYSSVRLRELFDIEQSLERLRSPDWPRSVFGALDNSLVKAGQPVFDQHCWSCHNDLARKDLDSRIKARMTPVMEVGTDIWSACNTMLHTSNSGLLEGRKAEYLVGPEIGPTARTAALLRHLIIGAVEGKAIDYLSRINREIGLLGEPSVPRVAAPQGAGGKSAIERRDARQKDMKEKCEAQGDNELMRYKARPLNGIWATAPYLHNGSVPTLADLLEPVAKRPTSFHLGDREYDPKKVGFLGTKGADTKEFRVNDEYNNPIPGNSNAGHIYGTQLTEVEKKALLEYLKSL